MLTDPDVTVTDVAQQYGVSRTTIYNALGPVQPIREPASTVAV